MTKFKLFKRINMRRSLLFFISLLTLQAIAQEEKLRVSFKLDDMPKVELNVNDIKEINFVEEKNPLNIEGEWFNVDDDVFQSLTFTDDGVVKHYYYNNYLNGAESGKYWYQYDVFGISLSLWGNLYLPVVSHSENSFTWRYENKNRTYYKVKNVYEMEIGDDPISIGYDGDIIKYIDNVFIELENGKVKALQPGSGFVLVEDAKLKTIVAYRINVKEPLHFIDWTINFKKTKDEIVAEFGNQYRESSGSITYTNTKESIFKYIVFLFDENTGKVNGISLTFGQYESFQSYYEYINANYILNEEMSSSTYKVYYDTENIVTSSVKIIIDISWMNIGYGT